MEWNLKNEDGIYGWFQKMCKHGGKDDVDESYHINEAQFWWECNIFGVGFRDWVTETELEFNRMPWFEEFGDHFVF